MTSFDNFTALDIRVGQIIEVEPFPRARNPSYRLTVDFGPEIGRRRSIAQATNYSPEQLLQTQVVAIVNLPPKNIAGTQSEVLILGAPSADDPARVSLVVPSRPAVLGGRLY